MMVKKETIKTLSDLFESAGACVSRTEDEVRATWSSPGGAGTHMVAVRRGRGDVYFHEYSVVTYFPPHLDHPNLVSEGMTHGGLLDVLGDVSKYSPLVGTARGWKVRNLLGTL